MYKLRIAPCFALSQSCRYSHSRDALHRSMLIPVTFEIADSLLHTLGV